ncbi:MAG: 50S ribosomal protein L6 [Bacteroidales bacterium]|jgi:large subunit ribosomal protein L6|nr:50S ribosomal protein L6 [Bacteroidales bacterium]NCU36737.1 50S ribosomal protein L6 [Candidatus Falkowbacteria bacterium]MDD3525361.1 50S ribosomal protein L6 [Bacteroidales bacterium]MDD4177000.1 50S ribosomal protein L6 [Bacteroidales bacterium]MDD4740328.1 50S ribosomal protein L6 [Bacteroidales bacterium]
MSRIGKSPIALPEGVKVEIADNNLITVSGKLGTLHQKVDPDITVAVEDGQILLQRPTEQKRHKALHGLYRSLLANMVKGVTEGFTIQQELVGVGYKAQANGQNLELSLGYSHSIILVLPPEIKLETVTERGKNPTIKMTCADKQLVGQVAAKIRSLRKPEPYKGKGVKYVGEEIKRKAGKAAAG